MTARETALRALMRCEGQASYSNLTLDTALERSNLTPEDKRLCTRLVYGTIEKQITLDYILAQFSSKPIAKLDLSVCCILRMGAYQIMYADRIPERAAVDESVELCKKFALSAAPFVNAVLRSLCRGKNEIKYPDKNADSILYLSVVYGVSPDICKIISSDYGFGRAESILAAMNTTPAVTLRVNTLKITRDELLSRLENSGTWASAAKFSPVGINTNVNTAELSELKDGLCFVQDEASQICAAALGAKPGENVLDVCAAPGGKSFSIAMEMENRGSISSYDLHANKISLIDSGASKLGISIIKTCARDGRKFDESLKESADRILCDLPCSGIGVIAKKPDIRHKTASDFERLPEIQLEILNNSAKYLKQGGTMVFSTCTISKTENEGTLSAFLKANPDFILCDFEVYGLKSDKGTLALFPDTHGCDGFFMAKMIKKEK